MTLERWEKRRVKEKKSEGEKDRRKRYDWKENQMKVRKKHDGRNIRLGGWEKRVSILKKMEARGVKRETVTK